MPTSRPCPSCGAPAPTLLNAASMHAVVWYLRCGTCGHVWTVPKNNPSGPQRDVTIPRNRR